MTGKAELCLTSLNPSCITGPACGGNSQDLMSVYVMLTKIDPTGMT